MKQRLIVMNGQRVVQNEQDGRWQNDKVEKAGRVKPGVYNIYLSGQADKTKEYVGIILHADKNNVYRHVGNGYISHNRADFNKVPDVGMIKNISCDKLEKAVVSEASTVNFKQGPPR